MKTEMYIDYSPHCIKAEMAMKALHNAMLEKQYAEAKEQTLLAIAELKLTLNAIRYAEEKDTR